jgi:hypothetical protein
MTEDDATQTGGRPLGFGITGREAEILQLVGTGATNAAIGARLHISAGTVKTPRQHLRQAWSPVPRGSPHTHRQHAILATRLSQRPSASTTRGTVIATYVSTPGVIRLDRRHGLDPIPLRGLISRSGIWPHLPAVRWYDPQTGRAAFVNSPWERQPPPSPTGRASDRRLSALARIERYRLLGDADQTLRFGRGGGRGRLA